MASSSPILVDSETVKIDPVGDVLLHVGSSELIARLLVSSKVLSLASPVFAAMFGPQFKEGNSLGSGRLCEIPLPEDDPEAITLLCNCLHFRTDHIPKNVEFSALKALAIVCDKYDSAKAITAWNTLWLQKWEASTCEDGFEGLLFVVYTLDCAEAFMKLSKKAILDQVGSFDTRRVLDGFDMVPESLLGMNRIFMDNNLHAFELTVVVDLDVKKAAVHASLHRAIEDLATPILADGYDNRLCSYRASSMYAYFRELKRCGLWPLSETFQQSSLSTISQRISSFQESNSNLKGTGSETRVCFCSVCETRFKPLLESVRTTHLCLITGLCLDCVKARGSKTSGEERNCRIAHS